MYIKMVMLCNVDAITAAETVLWQCCWQKGNVCVVNVVAMKSLRKLNLNSTYLSALTFEGLKVYI